ncbi:MAG: LysR family transcriptional regulator [Burkholderiales bacterium]
MSRNSLSFARLKENVNNYRVQPLDLKLLETFVVVAETRSFKAGAVRLNMTQPAVSNRILRLERLLGARLFERTTRACHLSAIGRGLLDDARRVLGFANELRANIAEPHGIGGTVAIGVVETIVLTWLPDLVASVAQNLPRIQLRIEVDLSSALLRKLQKREIDLACVVAPVVWTGIASEPLDVLSMAWVARPDFPLGRTPIGPDALSHHPIFVHSGARHMPALEAWLRRSRRAPQRIIGCNSLSAIVKLTLSGAGLSLVPLRAVEHELGTGQLKVIPTIDPMPSNSFEIAYSSLAMDRSARAILDVIKQTVTRSKRLDISV